MSRDWFPPMTVKIPRPLHLVYYGKNFLGPTFDTVTFELTKMAGFSFVRGAMFLPTTLGRDENGNVIYGTAALGYRCAECKTVFFGHQEDRSYEYLRHYCTDNYRYA